MQEWWGENYGVAEIFSKFTQVFWSAGGDRR